MNRVQQEGSGKYFPVTELNNGNNAMLVPMANINAKNVVINDSPRNCFSNCDLPAPNTFRTPISVLLLIDWAVARLV